MKKMTVEEFAMQTASNEPVPGGGSISALAGALAAVLLTVSVIGVVKDKTNDAVGKIAYEERINAAFEEPTSGKA